MHTLACLIIHAVDQSWRKKKESKQQWSQPMRGVCDAQSMPMPWRKKSQWAHWRSARCASAVSHRIIQKKPLRGWGKAGHSQDIMPNSSHCLSGWLEFCLLLTLLGKFYLFIYLYLVKIKAEVGCCILICPKFNLYWSAENRTYHWEQWGWMRGWARILSLYETRALENKRGLQRDNNRLFLRSYTDLFRSR